MQIHWKKLTLGDLGQIITGKTPSTQNSLFWDGNIPFITPKDIQSSKHILTTERYLSQDGAHAVKSSILPKDSICVSCIGNIGYIGKTTKLSVSNQQINSIIPNQYNDSDFIYYLMKSLWVYFKNYEGQSTALSILNKSQFSNIEISIPPLDVQKKIAGVLGALDDKIELNNKINQNLEAQAQALFKSWFIDFEPFGGKMPNDWKECCLGDICECLLGGTPNRNIPEYWNGDIPWINSGEVNNFRIVKPSEYISKLGLSKSTRKLLPEKTTVIAITCATLGQVSLLEIKACANQSVVGILQNSDMPYEFIFPFIKYNILDLISHQTGGAQQHINKQNVEHMHVLKPAKDVLLKYKKTLEPLYKMIAKNCFENIRFAELRDTLLPKLMNGEINVDNVKID